MMRIFSFILTVIAGISFAQIDVSIRFEKYLHYQGSPIIVYFKVENNTKNEFQFMINERYIWKSIFFDIRTPQNKVIEPRFDFQVLMNEAKGSPDDYRKVVLYPRESMEIRFDISKYFNLYANRDYYIRAVFYPTIEHQYDNVAYYSPFVRFYLSPPPIVREEIKAIAREKKVSPTPLPPYKVVERILQARKTKDFDTYFMYFDLERFIISYSQEFKEKYIKSSPSKRSEVINDLKEFIKGYRAREYISDFKIIKTTIEEDKAIVIAIVNIKVKRVFIPKKYTFYLYNKSGDLWLIYKYNVDNIGTGEY